MMLCYKRAKFSCFVFVFVGGLDFCLQKLLLRGLLEYSSLGVLSQEDVF